MLSLSIHLQLNLELSFVGGARAGAVWHVSAGSEGISLLLCRLQLLGQLWAVLDWISLLHHLNGGVVCDISVLKVWGSSSQKPIWPLPITQPWPAALPYCVAAPSRFSSFSLTVFFWPSDWEGWTWVEALYNSLCCLWLLSENEGCCQHSKVQLRRNKTTHRGPRPHSAAICLPPPPPLPARQSEGYTRAYQGHTRAYQGLPGPYQGLPGCTGHTQCPSVLPPHAQKSAQGK